MEEKRANPDCGKYTLLVGLVKVCEDRINEHKPSDSLEVIKDDLKRKVLNINNNIKSLCDYYDREKHMNKDKQPQELEVNDAIKSTARNLARYVERGEFFVYSVSLTFNPRITSVADLLKQNNEGDGVCTIVVKMPRDPRRQDFYIKLVLKLISRHSLLLKCTEEKGLSIMRQRKPEGEPVTPPTRTHAPEPKAAEPVPWYFDDDQNCSNTPGQGQQYVRAGMNSYSSYSFFNQSSMILSKYVNSNLVVHEDDRIMAERLMREKEKKRRELLGHVHRR